ncbi:MAG: selenium cofactor biosynthesis protein YqeC, partial [Acidobacteriota bacterium]
VLCGNDARCLQLVLNQLGRSADPHLRRLVVAGIEQRPDLLLGVRPDFTAAVDRDLFPVILNEADGARSMSLKVPREGEPVLMDGSNYLVPVIGLDCLNKPLGPETLFRWELARARHSLHAGGTITPDLAASLLLHPEGVCRDWRPGIQIIPYINKADSAVQDSLVRELGQAILHNGNFPVERIVWGSLHFDRAGVIPPNVH